MRQGHSGAATPGGSLQPQALTTQHGAEKWGQRPQESGQTGTSLTPGVPIWQPGDKSGKEGAQGKHWIPFQGQGTWHSQERDPGLFPLKPVKAGSLGQQGNVRGKFRCELKVGVSKYSPFLGMGPLRAQARGLLALTVMAGAAAPPRLQQDSWGAEARPRDAHDLVTAL